MMNNLIWKIKTFNELATKEFHEILKARIDVFIVEQTCPYPELDGYDQEAVHLWAENEGEVVAYCRLFDSGIKYKEASIGRVLTNQKYRKRNLGRTLLRFAINTVESRFRTSSIRISAQNYLLPLYREFGFVEVGETYLEDDIPHTEMKRD